MGKNKKNKTNNQSGKQAERSKNQISMKLHRNGKLSRTKPDHLQDIPFRLREIMKSQERMKTGASKSNKLREDESRQDSHVEDIPSLHFKKGKNESVKAYVRRMESETKHILFLSKNQVERKPELDADNQERPANKGKSEKKKEYDKVRLQRLQKKKLDRQEAKNEKEMFIDHVPFGEVAMAPPSLGSKPKKAQLKSQKDSKKLLLHSLLGQTVNSTSKPSMARQRIMEEERERVVQAYRYLKKQKQQQLEAQAAALEKLKNL